VDYVQKAFDVITEVFEAVGAKAKSLFGWLAWLLDWDDIKKTAQQFQDTVNGFQSWSQVCHEHDNRDSTEFFAGFVDERLADDYPK
jgi:hypothetical protein